MPSSRSSPISTGAIREVRAAIYDVMRFWLRKGVDGFRVDVIWHLIKDEQFRDNPPNPAFRPDRPPHESLLPRYTADQAGSAGRDRGNARRDR